jgi:hypothetical protein
MSESYRVQGKNGVWSGWTTKRKCRSLPAAIQKAQSLYKKLRGRQGTTWYKTRVVNEAGVRVYPPNGEEQE